MPLLEEIIFSDLSPNLTIHPVNGDIIKSVNEQSIRNSIKNLILTNKGERPFESDVGSNITKSLFDNMDSAAAYQILLNIQNTINTYEPRVELDDILVTPVPSDNSFHIVIRYRIINSSEQVRNLDIQFERDFAL